MRRIEGQRESSDHPRKHVDAERKPWPCDELTGLLVHDHDIHLRVIDLNEVEGPFDLQLPRRRLHRLLSGFVLSQARPFKRIDAVNTTPDGARIGRLLSVISATRRDLTHEFTERRPLGNEIDLTNRGLNDRLDALRNVTRAHWPSCLSRQEHRNSPIFTEALDQPIEARDADPQFRGSFSNSRSPDAAGPLLCDQPSKFFFPTTSFLPTRSVVPRRLGPGVHVVVLHSPCMRDTPWICAAQQGNCPKLDESSQINASANRLKVHRPLYRG